MYINLLWNSTAWITFSVYYGENMYLQSYFDLCLAHIAVLRYFFFKKRLIRTSIQINGSFSTHNKCKSKYDQRDTFLHIKLNHRNQSNSKIYSQYLTSTSKSKICRESAYVESTATTGKELQVGIWLKIWNSNLRTVQVTPSSRKSLRASF